MDIVSAPKRAKCQVNYSCRLGICSECSGSVIAGIYTTGRDGSILTILPDESPVNVLMCQTYAQSDLVVEFPEKRAISPIKAVQIVTMEYPSDEVVIVTLATLDKKPFAQ